MLPFGGKVERRGRQAIAKTVCKDGVITITSGVSYTG